MKSKKTLFLLSLLVGSFAYLTLSSSSGGVMGASTSGCGGAGCHSIGATTVNLTGLPATGFTAGTTYTLTLSVSNSLMSKAGFDLTVTAGTISGAPSGTMLMGGTELHHTSPKTMASGIATWSFSWTAPATASTASFNMSCNAVNGDNGSGGDAYALSTVTTNKAWPAAVNDLNPSVISLYPNPTTSNLTLNSTVAIDAKQIYVLSMNGSILQTNVEKLSETSFKINTSTLANGNYFLMASHNGKSFTQAFSKL